MIDTVIMTPLTKGLLWFLPGLTILILISLFIFDEDGKMRENARKVKSSLWKARGGIFLLLLVVLALQIANLITEVYETGFRVTSWVYKLEGSSHAIWLQQNLNNPFLVHSSSIFYVLGLAFFVAFFPVYFILRNEVDLFEQLSKALAVNYMFLIPGYLLLHLVVPSYHDPAGVEPLTYSNEQYNALILLINRQTNCFPSGHTSIPFTLTLIALYSAKLKRLGIFGIVFTILTVFVIIFLGIHWLIDIPGGIALALFAYWSTSTGKMDLIFRPLIDGFKDLTDRVI
ncbi:MAG: phosphatase PAP2 family protein [Candidatus Thermoplasmatota archaeon]